MKERPIFSYSPNQKKVLQGATVFFLKKEIKKIN
jgi:hypothetical protein